MMKLFDSHAHYNDTAFGSPEERDALLLALPAQGIIGILNAGTNEKTSGEGIALARQFDFVYCAVGLHPEDLADIEDIDAALSSVEAMASFEKVKAIGEIGLDYHMEPVDRELQLYWFRRQMALAEKLHLPVIIHDRDAHGDCMTVIREYPAVRGVFHSYSGSAEMAAELIKRGYYISFSGVITFKNATRLSEIVKTIPADRLLIETDCPYLTPHPYRGSRNDSSYMRLTAEKAAALRGVPPDILSEETVANTKRLFSID